MLPQALLISLKDVPGFDQEAFVQVHGSAVQVTSIRINPAKHTKIDLPSSKIPWSTNGSYLNERPSFTLDPLFHGGAYYVQEASSMFLEEAVRQTVDLSGPIKVLDLCAAPGGKSTLLQSIVSDESLLVSNEVIKTRVNILEENMTKWGATNVVVTNNDPKDFQRLENYFDLIVVDAPCSGSGLFRKDPVAIDEWSENNVTLCGQRQQRILADIMPALKKNGILIYSTCSYSAVEDEEILDRVMEQFSLASCPLRIDNDWGIVETQSSIHKAKGYRFYPDKVKGEGFFIAVLKKESGLENTRIEVADKNKVEKISAKEMAVIADRISSPQQFYYIKIKDEVIAMPWFMQQELPILRSSLYIKKAGIKLGAIIRTELIPDHELALGTIIDGTVASINVDKATALQYLRKENFYLGANLKGWALIRHKGIALGWVKILPNRINNYYPAAWRILKK